MAPKKLPAKLMFMDEMGYSKDIPVLAYDWCPAGLQYLEQEWDGSYRQTHEDYYHLCNFREPTDDEKVLHEPVWRGMLKKVKEWRDADEQISQRMERKKKRKRLENCSIKSTEISDNLRE